MANDTKERTRRFLQLLFQDYYRTHHDSVNIPAKIHMREFGVESWYYTWRCNIRVEKTEDGSEIKSGCGESGTSFLPLTECPSCGSTDLDITNWSRHLGFKSKDLLLNEIVTNVPHSVYHSSAFYEFPIARRMIEKNWQGAELVFDIDADHLDIHCADNHDAWMCSNPECEHKGTGRPPEKCPECEGDSFSSFKWLCDRCLERAKRDTVKLYDKFLLKHFGIDEDKTILNYSGHRGYHIRVNDPKIHELDSNARSEIARYITGDGLSSSITSKGNLRVIPTGELRSWQLPSIARRIADAMIAFIDNLDFYEGNDRWLKYLVEGKKDAIDGLSRNPPILSYKVKGIGVKSWQEIVEQAITFYNAEIDLPVTHDIHRVIRLIGSLNGKTGFTVNHLTRDQLDDFDPFADPLAFANNQSIKLRIPEMRFSVPEFRIGDDLYGPYNNTNEELPMPAAVFLMCKGMASYERS